MLTGGKTLKILGDVVSEALQAVSLSVALLSLYFQNWYAFCEHVLPHSAAQPSAAAAARAQQNLTLIVLQEQFWQE